MVQDPHRDIPVISAEQKDLRIEITTKICGCIGNSLFRGTTNFCLPLSPNEITLLSDPQIYKIFPHSTEPRSHLDHLLSITKERIAFVSEICSYGENFQLYVNDGILYGNWGVLSRQ